MLLIIISFSFIFQGIWFNFKLFLIAFKHLFSERFPVTTCSMLSSRVSQGEIFNQ